MHSGALLTPKKTGGAVPAVQVLPPGTAHNLNHDGIFEQGLEPFAEFRQAITLARERARALRHSESSKSLCSNRAGPHSTPTPESAVPGWRGPRGCLVHGESIDSNNCVLR